MGQKNHIEYAQAKGAPAGFVLPYVVLKNALARYNFDDLPSGSATNIVLNSATGLIRVTAIGGGIYVAAKEDVTKGTTTPATVTLSIDDNPTHGDTMQIGDQEYIFKSSLLGKALATLTLTGAIVPGVHAESKIVVSGGNISNDDEVVIGSKTYVFKTALSTEPAVPNEVLIGENDAAALDNLKSAINGTAGEGTTYSTGTTAHPDVIATTNSDTAQIVQARVTGVLPNAIETTTTGANLDWADTTLGGGTGDSTPGVDGETVTVNDVTYTFVNVLSETSGATAVINEVLFGANSAAALDNLKLAVTAGATEGTNYSTGTEQPTDVTATTNTNTTQVFEAVTAGAAGNAYPVATDIANGSFGEEVTTFADGYDDDGKTIVIGNAATDTQTNTKKAINGEAGAGTNYSTGLVANELVVCGTFGSNDATITAQAAGAAGNGIETTETFTSSNNEFSADATEGGDSSATFDDYIASGETKEYGRDEDVTVFSLIAAGATTDVVVVEY